MDDGRPASNTQICSIMIRSIERVTSVVLATTRSGSIDSSIHQFEQIATSVSHVCGLESTKERQ